MRFTLHDHRNVRQIRTFVYEERLFVKHLTVISVLIAGICIVASTSFAAPTKKARQKIPAAITVQNDRAVELKSLTIAAAGAETKPVASLAKPLAAGKKTTLSLKGLKSCLVSVAAVFGDDGDADSEMDICKDRTVRFVD